MKINLKNLDDETWKTIQREADGLEHIVNHCPGKVDPLRNWCECGIIEIEWNRLRNIQINEQAKSNVLLPA